MGWSLSIVFFVLIYPHNAYIIAILIIDSFKVLHVVIMKMLKITTATSKSEIDGVMIKLGLKIRSCLASVPALIH